MHRPKRSTPDSPIKAVAHMVMGNTLSTCLNSSHKNKISRVEGEPVRAQPASTLESVNE